MFKGKGAKILFALVVIAMIAFAMYTKSNYTGYPVQTNMSDAKFDSLFSSAFDSKLGPQLKCNPGSADKDGRVMSSYYTGGLTPGGYCDDQEAVNAASNYKLVGQDAPLGE